MVVMMMMTAHWILGYPIFNQTQIFHDVDNQISRTPRNIRRVEALETNLLETWVDYSWAIDLVVKRSFYRNVGLSENFDGESWFTI